MCSLSSFLLQSLFSRCNAVLFDQLLGWMVYGMLVDRYNEFFIQKVKSQKVQNNKNVNWHIGEQESGSAVSLGWNEYQIIPNLLPSFVSLAIAEKILFVGRAVRFLKLHCGSDKNWVPSKHVTLISSHLQMPWLTLIFWSLQQL
jgi:hypothetical protein